MLDRAILRYQQRCHREYAASIGLPEPYTYPYGNPIRPLPPVQTRTGGLMIVGAYPSARFESRPSNNGSGRHRLVPVADNLQPFAEEQYFDGTRVRTLTSGDGLRAHLLGPLDLRLGDCWVTDLVKVFLYKPEHADSCSEVFPSFRVPELRSRFMELGRRSLPWLREECSLCRPKLVVTLGEEVARLISGLTASADDLLCREVERPESIGGWPALHLPHPDACRRSAKWRDQVAGRITTVAAML